MYSGQVSEQLNLRSFLREKEFLLLILLGIVYFYRPLFAGDTFFFRDLHSHFYYQKHLWRDLVTSGQLPLWDPFTQGGQPFLANPNCSVLYPLNVLFLVLPTLTAFNVFIVLHVLMCSAFAYLLARALGLSAASSFICGVVFGYCGVVLSSINILIRLMAVAYIPLILLCWHRYLATMRSRWFLVASGCGCLQVLTGAAETSILTYLTLFVWSMAYRYPGSTWFKRLKLWLLLILFTGGLSLVEVAPAVEMAMESRRGTGMTSIEATYWSLKPVELPDLVLPRFWGDPDTLSRQSYWRSRITQTTWPFYLSAYFGVFTILLAIAGTRSREAPGCAIPAGLRLSLLGIAVGGVLLAMGSSLPLSSGVFRLLPFAQAFRFPVKCLTLAVLPIALLAACGAEVHFGAKSSRSPSGIFLACLWGFWLTLAIPAAGALFGFEWLLQLQHAFCGDRNPAITRGLFRSFLMASVVWLAVVLTYHLRKWKQTTLPLRLAALIICVDLAWAGRVLNPYTDESIFLRTPGAAPLVKQALGGGRMYRAPDPGEPVLKAPSDELHWMFRWLAEVLQPNQARLQGIPVVYHSDVEELARREVANLRDLVQTVPWNAKLKLLSAGGARVIVTTESLELPDLHRLAVVRNMSRDPVYVYEYPKAAGVATFVSNWIFIPSHMEALKVMLSPTFDPRHSVVLEGERKPLVANRCSARVQTRFEAANSSLHEVENPCDGYLVFAHSYYPGWNVQVDGKASKVTPANGAYYAVFLPAGRHIVERSYMPRAVLLGFAGSVLFAAALIVIYVRDRQRVPR